MNIIVTVLEAVLLVSAGMIAILVIHFVVIWWCLAFNNRSELPRQEKPTADSGLSMSDLEKLPKLAGKDLGAAETMECAVCLEEIQGDELARVVPVCNHGFHLVCVDTWLSKHSVCPLCRAQIAPHSPSPSENIRSRL